MPRVFTKDNLARLTPYERRILMDMQMHPGGHYSDYLPDDCSECGGCGNPTLGSGWCEECHKEFDFLIRKAAGREGLT